MRKLVLELWVGCNIFVEARLRGRVEVEKKIICFEGEVCERVCFFVE